MRISHLHVTPQASSRASVAPPEISQEGRHPNDPEFASEYVYAERTDDEIIAELTEIAHTRPFTYSLLMGGYM